jgi:small redox-active disulfide protein 2
MQIKVDGHPVGIMALKETMEDMAKTFAHRSDQEIKDELLRRLSKKNYFPEKVKESYGKAFLREFRKFLGRPYEEEVGEGIQIKVLGPGCPQCDRLEQALFEVMSQMNLPADVEHVRDIKEIGRYGVMGTPALIINGEVKAVGKVPSKNQMIKWLEAIKK